MTVEKEVIALSQTSRRRDIIFGFESGLLTGLLLGVISVPLNYLLSSYYSSDIQRFLTGFEPTVSGVIGLSVETVVLVACVGLLFGLFHDFLPGKNAFIKVLIFGVLVFVGTSLTDYVMDYPFSAGLFYTETIIDVPLFLVLFPYLISKFFCRFQALSGSTSIRV